MALVKGEDVDVIYLDFSKAFDRVPHKRLLKKLWGYGIRGNIHAWIKDFLFNSTQHVKINGNLSESIQVTSGVPQGSVLGPIFFLIYINNLTEMITVIMKLFADDAKVYWSISSVDHVHLEYTVTVCSPLYKKDMIVIENVQRRATKLVCSRRYLSYQERLINLGLPSLEYRRERVELLRFTNL